jgi:Zn-dependent peptidase ImmA (M78 family)
VFNSLARTSEATKFALIWLFRKEGSRHYDDVLEAEANWLGPALLVSEEVAIHIVEQKMAIDVASDHYGASSQLVQMRLNVSAAVIRVARRRAA